MGLFSQRMSESVPLCGHCNEMLSSMSVHWGFIQIQSFGKQGPIPIESLLPTVGGGTGGCGLIKRTPFQLAVLSVVGLVTVFQFPSGVVVMNERKIDEVGDGAKKWSQQLSSWFITVKEFFLLLFRLL